MPVRVKLPDGRYANFPDGMPKEEIEAVLRRQFGGPEEPPAPPAPAPEDIARAAIQTPPETFGSLYGGAAGELTPSPDELGPRPQEFEHITTFGPPIASRVQRGPEGQRQRTSEALLATGAAISGLPGPMAVELPLQFAGGAMMEKGAEPEAGAAEMATAGAADVGVNLALRGLGKLVGGVIRSAKARGGGEAVEAATEAASGPERAVHAAGRAKTRARLSEALLEAGYLEGDLKGKSATQMAEMLREQGIDPKTVGRSAEAAQDVVPEVESPVERVAVEADDEFVDRSLVKMHDRPSDLEAIIEGERKAARGGPSRAVQEAIDRDELARTGPVQDTVTDDTLFPERFEAEASRDIPTEGIEDAPAQLEVRPGERVEAKPRDAWHPQHGHVRVDVTKGDTVLATDMRGRARVLDRRDVKYITPEEMGERAAEVTAEDDLLYQMGVEPDTPPAKAPPAETGTTVSVDETISPPPQMGMGQAKAGKGTRQHRSFKKKPGTVRGAAADYPTPKVGKGSELPKPIVQKLRSALETQALGRTDAEQRLVALHARQGRTWGKWLDAAEAGEITHAQARIKALEDMARKGASIEDVPGANFTPEEMEALSRYAMKQIPDKLRLTKGRMLRTIEGIQTGRQLQPNELQALRHYLGPAYVPKSKLDWNMWRFLKRLPWMLTGNLRALKAGFDLSGYRQGKQLVVSNPKEALGATWAQLQALVSEGKYKSIMQAIQDNPLRELQEAAGLHLSDLSSPVEATLVGGNAEEAFAHSVIQKIPGLRGTERAYVTLLNKMRSDVFNKMAYSMMRNGMQPSTHPKEFQRLAKAVNLMSGWAKLGKVGEEAMPFFQLVQFAPRFTASRFMILRDLPILYANYPKPVRKMLLKGVVGDILLTSGAIAGASALAGYDVETDPRSSDFMKPRMGRLRLDPWAGFQPFVRLVAQLATGQAKSPVTGEVQDLGGFSRSRLTSLARFFRQKASPGAGIAMDLLAGETSVGEPVKILQEQFPYVDKWVLEQVAPFIVQDIVETVNEVGAEELMLTVPFGALGGGVQTFDSPDDRKRGTF